MCVNLQLERKFIYVVQLGVFLCLANAIYMVYHTTHDGRDQHFRCCAHCVISSCVTAKYGLPVGNSGEL